ncbi:MAG: DUF2807 domain-containing protein [Bacteroidales bacterium]|nr:DUF2807 domain-containing protein [Bacteroidales bacterium]
MKGKIIVAIIAAAAALSSCLYQLEPHKTTETERRGREIEKFSQIEINGLGEIHYTRGRTDSLIVEGDPALVIRTDAKNEGEMLKVDVNYGYKVDMRRHSQPVITVQSKRLSNVLAYNRGRFVTLDTLKGERVRLVADGDGLIDVRAIAAEEVELVATGNAIIRIGHVEGSRLCVRGYGQGKVSVSTAMTTTADLIGIGEAEVNVGAVGQLSEGATVNVREEGRAKVKYRKE